MLPLFRAYGRSPTARLALTLHLRAVLAGGDAVPIAFEDFLGNPADDRRFVFRAVELLQKLGFKLLDVCHRDVVLADKFDLRNSVCRSALWTHRP
jgi:hypothetical protein